MRRRGVVPLLLALAGCAAGANAPPPPPPAAPPAPAGELLDPARIAALPDPDREAWTRYLETSRALRALDRAAMDAELRALGRERWTPAPSGPALEVRGLTDEWLRGEEGARVAEVVLSFQTPAGGWSKRVDMRTRPRLPGESYASESGWSYVGTFDNDATTRQLRFLAAAHAARGEARLGDAFLRGMEYVFRAQFPTGCWPQVYPLQGGYHDAATFNDEATAEVLRLLRDVGERGLGPAPEAVRERARASFARGIGCILASQVVVDGRRTAWGQQHDPITLLPVGARAYEHASLSAGESPDLVELLMQLPSPDARVVEAVHAAATWFRRTAIHGFEYRPAEGLVAREGAGPLWARFYEIGTDRPIFSNRDGAVRYRFEELDEERRTGYAWFRDGGAAVLERYERWKERHPALPRPPRARGHPDGADRTAPRRTEVVALLQEGDRASCPTMVRTAARYSSSSKWAGSTIAWTAHPWIQLTATAASPSAVTPRKVPGSARSSSSTISRNAAR